MLGLDSLHIDRTSQLLWLHANIQSNNLLILEGEKGTGKTQLLRDYIEEYGLEYGSIYQMMSFQPDTPEDIWPDLKQAHPGMPSLLIADGLDTHYRSEDRDTLLHFIRQSSSYPIKIVMLCRNNNETTFPFFQLCPSVQLHGFDTEETDRLVNVLKKEYAMSDDVLEYCNLLVPSMWGNPREIHELFESTSFEFDRQSGIEINHHIQGISPLQKIEYTSEIITQPLITDIKVVNDYLLDKVQKNPKLVYDLPPRKFEEMVADLFIRQGYKVTLTQQTRDDGLDMFVLDHTQFGKSLYLVECKRNKKSRPVGVSVIRQLHGVVQAKKASAGIVVTSSYFSKPAKDFQESIEHQMNLVDYVKLLKLVDKLKQK